MNFFIKTFGCQMNVNDSEKIRHLAGGQRVELDRRRGAGRYHHRQQLRRAPEIPGQDFSYIGRIPRARKVILAGCVAQVECGKTRSSASASPITWWAIAPVVIALDRIVEKIFQQRQPVRPYLFPPMAPANWSRMPRTVTSPVTAYVAIMEGCDTLPYCIVPFAWRPREAPTVPIHIMREAERC